MRAAVARARTSTLTASCSRSLRAPSRRSTTAQLVSMSCARWSKSIVVQSGRRHRTRRTSRTPKQHRPQFHRRCGPPRALRLLECKGRQRHHLRKEPHHNATVPESERALVRLTL
eukprot:6199091-Pleurochrysis_carterae.AAC.2